MHKTLTVTLVAGGSGGHIFPALSVLQSLRQLRPDMRGCLVTTRHPRDQRAIASLPQLVRDAQVHLEFLPRMPTKWYGQLASAPMLWSAANKMLDQMQPHVVIGFGGWLTVPFLMAARLRKTTTVLHEQNVLPGLANRVLGRWVTVVAGSFTETHAAWPAISPKLTVTGNPIRFRNEMLTRHTAREHWGAHEEPLILALGGSGGSRAINRALPDACAALPAALRSRIHVLHLAGTADSSTVEDRYHRMGVRAHVVPFLDRMALAYRAADLVVSRAGASTIAELAHFGCPAVLIPYPYARKHQHKNAYSAARTGGAVVLEQSRDLQARLSSTLVQFLDTPDVLHNMGTQLRQLDHKEASDALADVIVQQYH